MDYYFECDNKSVNVVALANEEELFCDDFIVKRDVIWESEDEGCTFAASSKGYHTLSVSQNR